MISTYFYNSPFGELILGDFKGKLCLCDWRYRKMRATIDKRIQKGLKAEFTEKDTALLQQTRVELEAYFKQNRTEFDLPLELVGSDFQTNIWQELLKIPYGQTMSYHELSGRHGDVKAIRAVASANGANAISIIVPCHRIIGRDGSLTGYAGGLSVKEKLLRLEKAILPDPQLNLF